MRTRRPISKITTKTKTDNNDRTRTRARTTANGAGKPFGKYNTQEEYIRPKQPEADKIPPQSRQKKTNHPGKTPTPGDSLGPLTIITAHLTDTEVYRVIEDAKRAV